MTSNLASSRSSTDSHPKLIKCRSLFFSILSAVALLWTGCATTNAPESAGEAGWEKVTVTRNAEDVKGMTRLSDVSASAHKFFGDPGALRKEATMKIKKEAVKLGASTVLIQTDEFAPTPVNNVNMTGVAYK